MHSIIKSEVEFSLRLLKEEIELTSLVFNDFQRFALCRLQQAPKTGTLLTLPDGIAIHSLDVEFSEAAHYQTGPMMFLTPILSGCFVNHIPLNVKMHTYSGEPLSIMLRGEVPVVVRAKNSLQKDWGFERFI